MSSLKGLLTGISTDGLVSAEEAAFVLRWLDEHSELSGVYPFADIFPALRGSLEQGNLDGEVRADVEWLCRQILDSSDYDEFVSHELRLLQGIIGGIAADGVITLDELSELGAWMDEREHLRDAWPFTEIQSLLTTARRGKKLDDEMHKVLLAYFADFTRTEGHRALTVNFGERVSGVCAAGMEVALRGKRFVVTGASARASRSEFEASLRAAGAVVVGAVDAHVDYLVVGAEGNPCWHFACYGRKVERAIELRRGGRNIVILHEADAWDALADEGIEPNMARGAVAQGPPGLPMLLEPHLPRLRDLGWHVVSSAQTCMVYTRFKNGKPRANPAAEVHYDGAYDAAGSPVPSPGNRVPYLVRSNQLSGRRVGDASKAVAMFLEQVATLAP
jgi:hypothetical protein